MLYQFYINANSFIYKYKLNQSSRVQKIQQFRETFGALMNVKRLSFIRCFGKNFLFSLLTETFT